MEGPIWCPGTVLRSSAVTIGTNDRPRENSSSNSNPVSYWVTWQTNRELYTRTGQTWSRHSIAKTSVFAIEILNASNDVIWHQKILMLNFYSTYEFLSNFLCNWHELYYSPTFFRTPLSNRSIDIFLEFWRFCQSSELRFPPCLPAELPTTCYNHGIVTDKCQYSWRVWTSPVRWTRSSFPKPKRSFGNELVPNWNQCP